MLQAFSQHFVIEEIENPEIMKDFKAAVKDYLVHNIYRLAYDDVADSYYILNSKEARIDKRINVNKVIKWIDKVAKGAPQIVEELCLLENGKVLNK